MGYLKLVAVAGAVLLFTACNEAGMVPSGSNDVARSGASALDAPVCNSSGAHDKHTAITACTTCHFCQGSLTFDPSGPAYGPSLPAPTFDSTAKICSNVACHGVPAGNYSYTAWDWGADAPYTVTVPYGGSTGGGASPSWYSASGGGCTACHGNPPKYNGIPYIWHTGMHGNNLAYNRCELCHNDVVSTLVNGVYVGTSLSTATCGVAPNTYPCASQHGNGQATVTPAWRSQCFGCH